MGKPTCFIIQQYVEEGFDALYDAIEVAAKLAGYEPVRADKLLGAKSPMQKIQEQIANADVCVAEVNTRNENVYFEMGYASALEKPLFILWDKNLLDKLPFDISHKAALPYNSKDIDWTKKFREKLEENLTHELQNAPKMTGSKVVKKTKRTDVPAHEQEIEYNDLSLTIITALALAETEGGEISIPAMTQLMISLGFDSLDITVTLKKLLKHYYIHRDYNGNGDDRYSAYSLRQKGYDYLEEHASKSKEIRSKLPQTYRVFARTEDNWGRF